MAANSLSEVERIAAKEKEAVAVFEAFMRDSIKLRLGYEYSDKFFSDGDRRKLLRLAQNTSEELQSICDQQKDIQRRIESYNGVDWDRRYGETGLWRKIAADIGRSEELKCRCDYFAAMSLEGAERNLLVKDIFQRCGEGKVFDEKQAVLMRIGTLLLVTDNREGGKLLERQIDERRNKVGVSSRAVIEGEMLRAKCGGEISSAEISQLAMVFKISKGEDDFDLSMRFALLAMKAGRYDILAGITKKWPVAESLAGEVILGTINTDTDDGIAKRHIEEVDLAVKTIRETGTAGKYKSLLKKLCGVKRFRNAGVLQVAAEGHVDTEPLAAMEYFVEAAKEQRSNGGSLDGVSDDELAMRAAEIGYGLYCEDSGFGKVAIGTLGFYCNFADEDADEQLRYIYAGLLKNNGRNDESERLLEGIVKSSGTWAINARFDLLADRIAETQGNEKERSRLAGELNKLIGGIDIEKANERQVQERAIEVYCGLLLEKDTEANAKRVMGILANIEATQNVMRSVLKAEALRQLGRIHEAVEILHKISMSGRDLWPTVAVDILTELLDSGNETGWETNTEPSEFIIKCDKLAERTLEYATKEWREYAELVRAETAILASGAGTGGVGLAEKLLSKLEQEGYQKDINWMRATGRLLMAKGEFAEASRMWGRVQQARRGKRSEPRALQWWRGKYYEIKCWSQLDGVEQEEVIHAIEVLEGSLGKTPALWSDKFKALKQR